MSASLYFLLADQLNEKFTANALSKGEMMSSFRLITDLKITDELVSGSVGSQSKRGVFYQVNFSLVKDAKYPGDCNCKAPLNCKHQAALLLRAKEELLESPDKVQRYRQELLLENGDIRKYCHPYILEYKKLESPEISISDITRNSIEYLVNDMNVLVKPVPEKGLFISFDSDYSEKVLSPAAMIVVAEVIQLIQENRLYSLLSNSEAGLKAELDKYKLKKEDLKRENISIKVEEDQVKLDFSKTDFLQKTHAFSSLNGFKNALKVTVDMPPNVKERTLAISFSMDKTHVPGLNFRLYMAKLSSRNKKVTSLSEVFWEDMISEDNITSQQLLLVTKLMKTSSENFAFHNNQSEESINRMAHLFLKQNWSYISEMPVFTHNHFRSPIAQVPSSFFPEPLEMRLYVRKKERYYIFGHYFYSGNKKINLDNATIISNVLFYSKNRFYLPARLEYMRLLGIFEGKESVKILAADFPSIYKNYISEIKDYIKIDMPDTSISQNKEPKTQKDKISYSIFLSELDKFVLFKPMISINDKLHDLLIYPEDMLDEERRNECIAIKDFMASLHPKFERQVSRGFFYLFFEEMLENGWFFETSEILEDRKIELYGLDKLKSSPYSLHKPTASVKVSSNIDWFDIKLNVNFGEQNVSLANIRKSILRKENYVNLKDGKRGVLPKEWLDKFRCYFERGEIKKGKIQVSKYQFNILDDFDKDVFDKKTWKELREKKKKLLEFEKIKEVTLPEGLQAELRHYQKEGVKWLNCLDEMGWGGCLADDMGLGKTVQAITFLLMQIQQKPNQPNLVVAPTSLIFNWEEELQKFAPGIDFILYHGNDRLKSLSENLDHHLVITSYGILARDIEEFSRIHFNYAILDESQAIKNPMTKRFKAVRQLKSKNRLVMTGTPIENNTFDLYAQMHFLNPGMLGSLTNFKENYSTAIDKFKDAGKAAELQKLIFPFLLRRTKDQVVKELPGKMESTLYCEMDKEQRKVYDTFKAHLREKIINSMNSDGLNQSKIMVLDAMLKLRQICNSPKLINSEEDYGDQSIKIKELVRNIREKTGNHKILIFSQFVKMLKLIKTELEKYDIQHEYLDGQTTNRMSKVREFQENEDCRVFLISLKAGGTGLNLMAADYVFIVDPWWNPAVENQAIDRTYRIGQTKKVFAYRMICKDTIEEKILKLQEHKTSVANELITTDDGVFKSLEKEDIMQLFS